MEVMDVESRLGEGSGDYLFCGENDTGLNLLLPLYQFLRNDCADAAHLTLLKGFRDAEYITKYLKHNLAGGSLYNLMKEIHRLGKKGNSKDQKTKRFNQIHNLSENESTLILLTTQDLIDQNVEKCKVLKDLDLAFVLNVMANGYLQYTFNESVYEAVIQIKEIRNKLFHPRLNFNQSDFDENFDELIQATEKLYQYASPNEPKRDLQKMKQMYEDQVVKEDVGCKIFEQLQKEIHEKYAVLQTYVPPIIVDESADHEKIIEDFPNHIWNHSRLDSNRKCPVVFCGSAGSGKSTVLRNLATSSISCDRYRYSLVLYLDDWGRRASHFVPTSTDISTSIEFWEQIYNCIRHLAPNTIKMYGLNSVTAVIRRYMDSMLFIVNWNLTSLRSIFKEMTHGTWVVAHRNLEQHMNNDWQVVKIKPFTETLVSQLLLKCNGEDRNDILCLYKNCDYKHLLTSPDMIKVFQELKSSIKFDTDFELLEVFVMTKFKSKAMNVDEMNASLKLGEIAFNALKNGNKYVNRLDQVETAVRDLFLMYREGKGWQFVHSSVQEFMAARYVVHQPKKACREWLSNAPHFVNVFRFACGNWCKDAKKLDGAMGFIEQYLVELFDIISLKNCKNNHQEVEPMEVECKKKSKKSKKEKKPLTGSDQAFKNSFSNWDYFIAIDDICQGLPKILTLFAKLLSHSRCWTFKVGELDGRKFKRIEKVIKRVKFTDKHPVIIKLESGIDVRRMIEVWNKLKNIENLHDCAFIRISIKDVTGFPVIEGDYLASLCNTFVRAHCPIYITTYRGPLICSTTPEFLKCSALMKLYEVDVTVYDVASLCEIFKCDDLCDLKEISVNVELQRDEQLLTEVRRFTVPKHPSLMLRVKYFDNIQTFLERAISPCNLKSLAIYDVYVKEDFNLDLSAFQSMEKLSLRCEPYNEQSLDNIQRACGDENFHLGMGQDKMEVDGCSTCLDREKRVPRQSWMMPFTVNLKPPNKLKRLLLRNMDFFNNSNNYFLLSILEKHDLQKLVILDSQLSLKGVRQILSTHTNDKSSDEVESMTKRLKKNRLETSDLRKLISKNPRLSLAEREQRRLKKPKGKEVIITSDVDVCKTCCHFPCSCPDQDGVDSKDTVDDLVDLIEDVYEYDIVSFNYSSKVVTVRKDVCGDVRVHCALPGLNDTAASRDLASPVSYLNKVFLMLTLAQCICLEKTQLTFQGVKKIIDYLKFLKTEYSVAKNFQPFSLMVRSTYHPSNDQVISAFIATIQGEKNTFTTFNFWCSCENKCFKIKKTHGGKMVYNDRMLHEQ